MVVFLEAALPSVLPKPSLFFQFFFSPGTPLAVLLVVPFPPPPSKRIDIGPSQYLPPPDGARFLFTFFRPARTDRPRLAG